MGGRPELRAAIVAAAGASLRDAGGAAALLLAPAALLGRWPWPPALAFVAGLSALELIGNLALAIWRPAHFAVRQQGVVAAKQKKQPRADAIGAAVLLCFAVAWFAFIPLDALRLHILPAPAPWIAWCGAIAAALGIALTKLAVWENRFATPNVQDQTADGQRVIDTGVYAVIRHPIYLGYALLIGGGALWLGSTAAALIGVGCYLAATFARIVIEERDLNARLPAYAAYARRVRGRLIPFLL